MKLHTDGTPEEVAAYKRALHPFVTLTEQQYPTMERKGTIGLELTEEQVSSLLTCRLVEELSNRTGVNHIPVNEDDVLKLQIANQSKLSVKQREDLFGSKYILIERG